MQHFCFCFHFHKFNFWKHNFLHKFSPSIWLGAFDCSTTALYVGHTLNMQFYHTAHCHACHKLWGNMQLTCWLQECPPNPFQMSLQRIHQPHTSRPTKSTPAQDLCTWLPLQKYPEKTAKNHPRKAHVHAHRAQSHMLKWSEHNSR